MKLEKQKSDFHTFYPQVAVGIVSKWTPMAMPHVPFTIWNRSCLILTHPDLPTTNAVSDGSLLAIVATAACQLCNRLLLLEIVNHFMVKFGKT